LKLLLTFAQLLKIIDQIEFVKNTIEEGIDNTFDIMTGAIFNVISLDCLMQSKIPFK